MKSIRSLFSDETVKKFYIKAGSNFGDAFSYIYMGECVGFNRMLKKWKVWEQEYADRGYRTVTLDSFIDHGGFGIDIVDKIGVKREISEDPIYHAQNFQDAYEKIKYAEEN